MFGRLHKISTREEPRATDAPFADVFRAISYVILILGSGAADGYARYDDVEQLRAEQVFRVVS